MSTLSFYPFGLSFGNAGSNKGNPGQRGNASGWSASSARRNRQFLMSVNPAELFDDSKVVAFRGTFTVRDSPKNMATFQKLRNTWLTDLRRDRQMVRYCWVTEFQKRGTPHLHMLLFFPRSVINCQRVKIGTFVSDHTADPEPASPADTFALMLRRSWCHHIGHGAGERGQHVEEICIDKLHLWLAYLAKMGSRSRAHYQREMANLPKEYQTRPGRMWAKGGNWPLSRERFGADHQALARLRRVCRNLEVARARQKPSGTPEEARNRDRAIAAARRFNRHSDAAREVAIGRSVWLRPGDAERLQNWLLCLGHVLDLKRA